MGFVEEIKHTDARPQKIRETAITFAVIFGLTAGILFFKERSYTIALGIGLAFLGLGFFATPIMKPIHLGWMTLARIIGFFMSRIILTLVFYVIMWPISIIAKLKGQRFLDLKYPEPNRPSYWLEVEKKEFDPKNYEVQY